MPPAALSVPALCSYVQVLLYTFYTDLDFYYNLVPDVASLPPLLPGSLARGALTAVETAC